MSIADDIKAILPEGVTLTETPHVENEGKPNERRLATHFIASKGKDQLFKLIVPCPARFPYMLEQQHADPAVVTNHPVVSAFMLAPMIAAVLASSETKAILERE